MGIMVYSLFWVMQDLYHQPYHGILPGRPVVPLILFSPGTPLTKEEKEAEGYPLLSRGFSGRPPG